MIFFKLRKGTNDSEWIFIISYKKFEKIPGFLLMLLSKNSSGASSRLITRRSILFSLMATTSLRPVKPMKVIHG